MTKGVSASEKGMTKGIDPIGKFVNVQLSIINSESLEYPSFKHGFSVFEQIFTSLPSLKGEEMTYNR